MPRLDRRLARFALRAALVWALCVVPWPSLGAAFTTAFGGTANALVAGLRWHPNVPGVSLSIHFEPAVDAGAGPALNARAGPMIPNASWYTVLGIRNEQSGATTRSAICLRELSYVPLVTFVALTLAAPMRKNRVWVRSLAIGLALLLAFELVAVALPIVLVLGDPRVRAFALSQGEGSFLRAVSAAIIETSCAATVVLWALARWMARPGGDWLWLEEGGGDEARSRPSPSEAPRQLPLTRAR